MTKQGTWGVLVCGLLVLPLLLGHAWADEPLTPANAKPAKKVLSKDPPGMTRLAPDANLWIDPKNKRVVFDAAVCLRQGPLEMFACIKGTKEHESILAADVEARAVHAGLLAVGAKAGTPVQFPIKSETTGEIQEYRPATGSQIDITVIWQDDKKAVHRARAQDWIRNVQTHKAMEFPWVFAGSIILRDEESKTQQYLADQGDFICVSNFPSAMLDLPVESSAANSELLFEAFTDQIPPVGTMVRVVLSPKPEKSDKQPDKSKTAEK